MYPSLHVRTWLNWFFFCELGLTDNDVVFWCGCSCGRIWDTHNVLQKTVVKPTTPSAARVGVTTVAYNTTGKLLAAGMADGAIQVNPAEHTMHADQYVDSPFL
jgi:hypothetical protein